MSSEIKTSDHGYTGCNFCGIIKCHNALKQSILWVNCKHCHYISRLSGNPIKEFPAILTSPYTRPPLINRHLPETGWETSTPKDIHDWISGERLPNTNNYYHLLDYKPKDNRLISVKLPVTIPNYNIAARLANIEIIDDYDDVSTTTSSDSE